MPNWCMNKLTVKGDLEKFKEFIKEKGFSFSSITKLKTESESVAEREWGVKWDLDNEESKSCSESLIKDDIAIFSTAWNAPCRAIKTLSSLFPDAVFTLSYNEPSWVFCGKDKFVAGEEESIDYYEEFDSPEARKFLIDEFEWEFDDEEETEEAEQKQEQGTKQ